MKPSLLVLCCFLAVFLSACNRGREHHPSGLSYSKLELVAAYPVNSDGPVEPSGLTYWNGGLYTVADKDSQTIYRVVIGPEEARLIPALEFTPPDHYTMDWEGITVDAGGTFYLISEQLGRMLRVTADGTATWASPDLRSAAREQGLFAKSNAGFEGIAWIGPNHWLGAVEREPRGLVEWHRTSEGFSINPTLQELSPFIDALPLLRFPDYSGLDTDEGRLFALSRNSHLVVELAANTGSFDEIAAWSYRHIETDPRWAYRAQTYGQAEGLVVEGKDVYLIFDNNLGPRQGDPNDGRPLFVHARITN